MTIQEILNTKHHRPWPLPTQNWRFYQEWNRAVFLHWPVELAALKKLVPPTLEIDCFEGKPWVSVVAFTMENIRPKNLPAFPPVSNFDEINIRTYVRSNNKTGVYFLSIEGGNSWSCKLAKGISELPYRYSKMNRSEKEYTSTNAEFGDYLKLAYNVGHNQEKKSALDRWLTERYALFQDAGETMNAFEIHHVEWPLKTIEFSRIEINYPRFKELIVGEPHLLHYSPGVQVIAWGKNQQSLKPI